MTTCSDLGKVLGLAYQAIRLYPEQHPLRQRREAELLACWRGLDSPGPIEVDFDKRSFLTGDGGSARIGSPVFDDLARHAAELGIGIANLADADDALALLRGIAAGDDVCLPSDRSQDPVPAPPIASHESAETLLSEVWNQIVEARFFDAEALAKAVSALEQQPGCGCSTPVSLRAAAAGEPGLIAHSLNIGRLVQLAARTAGLRSSELERAVEAALLCDIGMLVVPSRLITSKNRLRPAEFRFIRKHPLDGARMLLATPHTPPMAAVVAFHHHRRRDQTGYPPLGGCTPPSGVSSLVQVADIYAALRTPRAFRSAVTEEQARELLTGMSGQILDPEAVELLINTTIPAGTVLMTADPALSTT